MDTPDPRLAPRPDDPAAATPTGAGALSSAEEDEDPEAPSGCSAAVDDVSERDAPPAPDADVLEPSTLELDVPDDGDGELPDEEEFADEGPVAPPVVAVLVTSDPGPWLEDALASLAAQEYPALSVLVLDNGSAEDPTARIAAAMPRAFIRRLENNVGFAAAANDAMATIEGATFLCFCHDDVVLEPDAVRIMVEEAYRSNAAVVGPKLVDYDHPEVLLEVGMAIDHYGVPFSGIEPGELDQEQHDAVRDVFFVSSAAMLVRADLFHSLGGFDPDTFPGADDVDLCWRARLVGARVLVSPDARVRHRRATMQDERPSPRNEQGDLRVWTRSRIRVLIKSYSALALIWVIPVAFLLNVGEAIAYVFARRPRRARALLAGWFSAVKPGTGLWSARRVTQRERSIDDGDVRDLMVRGSARVRTVVSYRLHAGDRIAEYSSRTRAAVTRASTRVRAWPVIAAIGLVLAIAFGSRALVLDRVPQVGSLRDWPSLGDLWSTFFSSWRYAMVGADAISPPAFGLMALLSTLLFGDTDLARTVVVAGAMPLGAYGAYRLARPLVDSSRPAVATAVAYAINPIVRNAIGAGQLGPLVCFALAPFLLRALMQAGTADAERRTRVHATLTAALLLLVMAAAWPPALAFAAVIVVAFVLAIPLVGGASTVGRIALCGGLATVAAAVLLGPWLASLVGADAATLALLPRRALDLDDILGFHTGTAGSGLASIGLLIAAMLPLAVATGERLAWAGRAWMLAVVSFAWAWLPSRLDADMPIASPNGVLIPAALGLALAVGLGVAAFLDDLRTFHFGWRQFVAVAAAVAIALPILGLAADTFQGRWRLSGDDWPSQFAWMDDTQADGEFRVLWVGDPTILPTDSKNADGVGYGLTRNGVGDARSLWAPPEGDAEAWLAHALYLTREHDTVRLGHLLAPIGVRYIAFVLRAMPEAGPRGRRDPALATGLAAQLDLAVSRAEGNAIVYENEAWIPLRAVAPEGSEVPLDSADPLAAAQASSLAGATAVAEGDTAGPGILLWGETADAGWSATLGGAATDRRDAYGWTNAFELDERGEIDISFSWRAYPILAWGQLLLWVLAAGAWFATRPRGPEAESR
jgi:GT2 family glycosyltransferase